MEKSESELNNCENLTLFTPMSHFYIPWKRYKTFGFLTFSGGTEIGHWREKGQSYEEKESKFTDILQTSLQGRFKKYRFLMLIDIS